jgi:hypothetical protein
MKMSPEHSFQQQQLAFTSRIRNPAVAPIPSEIPAERMDVYNELFYNGMYEHLSLNFPVLRELLSDEAWNALVRDFFIQHQCTTPLFTEIGLEFIEYLQQERETQAGDLPFMPELAHYEYAELAVSISNADETEQAQRQYDPNGDLLDGHPVVAPTAWNLSYQYPVHQIRHDNLPTEPPAEATHLVVYRDRQDKVHFLEINAVTQRLLTLLLENENISGNAALQQIAKELQHPQPDTLVEAGEQLLNDLRQRNVVWGSRALQEGKPG